jgi:hypothetical protein
MDLGKLFPIAFHQHRAMDLMRREHDAWVRSASIGVWWTIEPAGEWCLPNVREGQGNPYYERYEFVKAARPWPYPTKCLLTASGRKSWDIWFATGGTGFTQQRGNRLTYPELEALAEREFQAGSARMTQFVADATQRDLSRYKIPSLV